MAFSRTGEAKGLAPKSVTCIVQDDRGFLWIGTTDGLGRYDGYGFVFYRPQRKLGSLSHPTIEDIIVGEDTSLWIATWGGGVNRFDPETETFSALRHQPMAPSSLSDDRITTLAQTPDGTMWAGTPGGGLNHLEPSTGQVTVYRHRASDPSSLVADHVTRLLVDASGRLWVGTTQGLDLYDPAAGSFVRALQRDDAGPVDVQALADGVDGSLWLATTRGLIDFDPETGSWTFYRHDPADPASLGQDLLNTVAVDEKGGVWAGTDARGIDRLLSDGSFLHERHRPTDFDSLYEARVLDLFFDRSGVLWVGTDEGLLQSNPLSRVFSRHVADPNEPGSLPEGYVLALYEDRNSEVWIGTDQGLGLLQVNGRLLEQADLPGLPRPLREEQVTAFYRDRDGEMWIGTGRSGLFRQPLKGGFIHYAHDTADPSSLGSNDVPYLLEDSAGRFWVGTWAGGLNLLDRRSGRFTRYRRDPENPASLGDDAAVVIHESPPGVLWIGTWVSGLARFEPGEDPEEAEFEHFRFDPEDASSLGSNRVHDIHGRVVDEGGRLAGTLWIATWGGGLNRFDVGRGTFRAFTTADGLPSDSLYSILEDDTGKLWIATTRGIVRFDPTTEEIRSYDTSDGVQKSLFFYNCALRYRSGRLAFCGRDGFTTFQPSEVVENTLAPPVVLTGLEILGTPVDPGQIRAGDGHLELDWDERFVTVTVAALDFTAPHKNGFSYRLQAINEDWVNLGTRNVMTFSGLPAGEQVLQVRGTNGHGWVSDDALTVRIRVSPPWWGTWGFRGTALVAVALLLFAGHSFRLQMVRLRSQELEEEILRRRQAELASEDLIAELEKKNTELERFSATVAHDFKSPLFTVRAFLGYVFQNLDKGDDVAVRHDLDRIKAATGTMSHHLEALHELSHLGESLRLEEAVDLAELARRAVELVRGRLSEKDVEVRISPDLPTVTADRSRLLQVFQNLVDNAAKFVGDQDKPRIEILERHDTGENVTVVRDNGIGLAPEQCDRVFDIFHRVDKTVDGTGVGLTLVKRIVELHGGRIWVESEGKGQGCAFCFTVEPPFDRRPCGPKTTGSRS